MFVSRERRHARRFLFFCEQAEDGCAGEGGRGKARLKQCLPEALKVASAHRFLWRHAGAHASICSGTGGFLRRFVEDLEGGH
jgi:hypothetical protein